MSYPIQALSNMEYSLYGNTSAFGNTAVPSMYNNYCAQSNSLYGYMNPYMNPYGMYGSYSPSFGQNVNPYSSYINQNTQENTQNSSVFAGLNKTEQEALVKDYTKSLAPSESFVGAATGATVFSVLFHPRVIAHPYNTYKSFGNTKTLFADVAKEGTKLAEGWAQPGTNKILRDAYTAMNRIDARSFKKEGLHIWRKPITKDEYKELKDIMDQALKNFDMNNEASVKKLMEATETLNQANIKDGFVAKGGNWIQNVWRRIRGKEPINVSSVREAIDNKDAIKKAVDETYKAAVGGEQIAAKGGIEAAKALQSGKTYLQTLKTSSGGIGGAIFMLALEFFGSKDKIKSAFNKDKETGWKQVGQTTVKGLGSAVGWAAGDALGVWGCAKLFSKLGTKVKPGVGTAIGAIAGMVVGSIGSWLTGKVTTKIVGQDVGDKVQAEQLAKTDEGQVQLLQNTIQRMQKGEKVDPQAQQAVYKVIQQYSTAA